MATNSFFTSATIQKNKLLRAYGQGLDTNAALRSALNTDFDAMQSGFDELLERRFGATARALKGEGEEAL